MRCGMSVEFNFQDKSHRGILVTEESFIYHGNINPEARYGWAGVFFRYGCFLRMSELMLMSSIYTDYLYFALSFAIWGRLNNSLRGACEVDFYRTMKNKSVSSHTSKNMTKLVHFWNSKLKLWFFQKYLYRFKNWWTNLQSGLIEFAA